MTNVSHLEEAVLDRETDAGIRRIAISDETFEFHTIEIRDRRVTGAQIVQAAGKHPVDDFAVLMHLPSRELETLRPGEVVDLGGAGVERFFVIKSSESFRFIVDGLNLEWPLKSISGAHVKQLIGVGDDLELVLELENTPDEVIDDDELVHLNTACIERLKTRPAPRTVTVKYNHEPFTLERHKYTTEELMTVFSVPAGYKLDLVLPDGDFRELQPGKKLAVRDGMEFVSHAPCGNSS